MCDKDDEFLGDPKGEGCLEFRKFASSAVGLEFLAVVSESGGLVLYLQERKLTGKRK